MSRRAQNIKFVAMDPDSGRLPAKRRQTQHACDSCRQKKRRCCHNEDKPDDSRATNASQPPTATDGGSVEESHPNVSPANTRRHSRSSTTQQPQQPQQQSVLSPTSCHSNHALANGMVGTLDRAQHDQHASLVSHPTPRPQDAISPHSPASARAVGPRNESLKSRSARFVGDSNPEGMFLEAAGSAGGPGTPTQGDVGIWLSSVPNVTSHAHGDARPEASGGAGTSGAVSQPAQFTTSRPPPLMDRFLLPFVKESCLTCLPPEADFAKLRAVYIQKVHPMFPVIPFSAMHVPPSPENPSAVVLRQLVCLAAATDPDMRPYLRLLKHRESTELLSPHEYSQALSSSVRTTLDTSIVTDRVLHIRALTMLSLYTQPSSPEEADLPAQLGARAITHVQTLGLHILRYNPNPGPNPYHEDLENLFCAVWALDRINSAIYGRPCLIHERDLGTDMQASIKRRPPCFRLLLGVVQWLDHVIELYRPGPSEQASHLQKVAYIDLPVLEGMIVEAEALSVPSPLIATIETFYHAIIILSCRLPRPGTFSAASTLPPPSANARRSLAAERIACAAPRDGLSPCPLVPYALSLALSVEYRKMRHSRLPMFRLRAMTAFRRNCELLRSHGNHFWSASVMASLGESVLREMERAAASALAPGPGPNAATEEQNAGTRVPAFSEYERRLQQEAPPPSHPPRGLEPPDRDLSIDNLGNFSLFDADSGADIFGHMDPKFDLGAVEDMLEANLDISLPPDWSDWGQFLN